MARLNLIFFLLMVTASVTPGFAQTQARSVPVKSIYTSTERPWVWWFWLGNIVTEKNIDQQLRSFRKSGYGGVTVIGTYGVKGFEKSVVPFRSREWFEMIAYTIKQATELGMGVDLALSSAWPYGGPSVTEQTAAKMLKGCKSFQLKGGAILQDLLASREKQRVVAVSAFSSKHQYQDLSDSVSATGVLSAHLPQDNWHIEVLYSANTMQQVKRSSPGGEGLVLDHFSADATQAYMDGFDSSVHYLKGLRSAFNDSYEVYSADFTSHLLTEFEKRRGYSLKPWLSVLFDSTHSQLKERIQCDYRETIADLLLDGFVNTWTKWNHNYQFRVTEQAHGSPGNLLDLYGAADIPQTESFGPSHFSIPGVRTDPDIKRDRYKWPDKLMFKFATSAANVNGRKLCSAETATWLTNHFRMALSQVKPQVDELFVAGVNHVMLISATNTPPEVPFPGWVFYPAPDFGDRAPFYNYLPDFSNYISRSQHYLQNSTADNDILVYFPVYDYWSEGGNDLGILTTFDHIPTKWGNQFPFSRTIQNLWKGGYSFDYISDRQIAGLTADKKEIITAGGARYKVIVVPSCQRISTKTMEALCKLADQGIQVIFEKQLPSDVPGWSSLNERLGLLKHQKDHLSTLKNVVVTSDLFPALNEVGCVHEEFNASNLQFTRKKYGKSRFYFIANQDSIFRRGRVALGTDYNSVRLLDPITGKFYSPSVIRDGARKYIDLELLPGQSCFLFTDPEFNSPAAPFPYADTSRSFALSAEWTISFDKTEFMSPAPIRTSELKSWTNFPDTAVQFFCGTASYSAVVDMPADVQLGKVVKLSMPGLRDMAELFINNKRVGRSWSVPYNFDVEPGLLKRRNNKIVIRVTNLSTNRVIWMDRRKIEWKNFYIADPVKRSFDAADWELEPAGIIGEIRVTGTE